MKKILATVIALAVSCTMLASCGKDSEPLKVGTELTLGKEVDTDGEKLDDLIKEIEDGEFTMEMDVSEEGMTVYVYATSDGDDAYVEMNILGINMISLIKDDKGYVIDKETKTYYVTEVEEPDANDYISGGEFTKAYEIEADGEEYICEFYTDGTTEEGFIFADNGDVIGGCGYDEDGKLVLIPIYITTEFDKDKVEIPSGYKEVTEEEFTDAMLGNLTF